MMMHRNKILVLNGPNLNLLGLREPEHYGNQTLTGIIDDLEHNARQQNIELCHFQANSEEKLIERIHQALSDVDFIIFNPAAFTHTSVALRDALLAVNIPFIEIHLSNVYQRENFRHHSYFSDIAQGVICGLGAEGYSFALSYAISFLNKKM